MTNCFKKHWFLIIGILLLSNYSIGQSFITVLDGPVKENGRPFFIRLNPTSSITQECTSQTITLNIGSLVYLPGSNGPLPVGVTIDTLTNNVGEKILTIGGIINDGKQGSSLTMDISAQFKPGTCDRFAQEIKASTKNIGCNISSDQAGSTTVSSLTPNMADVQVSLTTGPGVTQPFCPRNIVKYTIWATNFGNQGFNLNNLKFHVEIDKCATLLGVYKTGTYVPVNTVTSSDGNVKLIDFDIPDLLLNIDNPNYGYDVYYTYPCLNGDNNDCTSGTKYFSAFLTGSKKGCGLNFESKKVTANHQITTTATKCGDVNCSTGGTVGELEAIQVSNMYSTLPCPSACLGIGGSYVGVSMYIPPLYPEYTKRVITVDIPVGVNVVYGYIFENTSCGTPYVIKYIDDQGNRHDYAFESPSIRKVEFTTDCTVSSPIVRYYVYVRYGDQNRPASGTYMPFKFNYSSDGKTIIEQAFGATIEGCKSDVNLVKQVRKASQPVFENNYNASAIPSEVMTYRQMVYNNGTGDSNNVIIDQVNENLIYEGGFKYAFEDMWTIYDPTLFVPLEGRDSFELDGLGKINVSVPAVGQTGGTIKLSGFNFPCTPKRLFIEYNVRVKNNVVAGTKIESSATITGSQPFYWSSQVTNISIAAFTYVKTKMFVKCSLANEWNESGINVKNGEVIDFKMQFTNAGSNSIVLSELLNLRPQPGDLFEFGSNPRKSTMNIDYNCDVPSVLLNAETVSGVNFNYAGNSVTMNRDMLCPPQSSGNIPNWQAACDNTNWLKASFPSNFKLLPGDYVDVIYKGRVSGTSGIANNSFSFKTGNCEIVSANSNTLAIVNDSIGIGCNSCTLTNPYSIEMKTLFENLLKNILTRKIKGESDASIKGSSPAELIALKPYITNGGGDKIYNFVSTVNAQNKITSISFSFTADGDKDVSFFEEKGIDYNPEVGAIDPSYLKIDTTLYSSAEQYLTTCRKTLDDNGAVISECSSKTQVKHIDFCPSRFCYPMSGEIKTGN